MLMQVQHLIPDDMPRAAGLAEQAQHRYQSRERLLSFWVSQTILREIRAAWADVHAAAVCGEPDALYTALVSLRQTIQELSAAEQGCFAGSLPNGQKKIRRIINPTDFAAYYRYFFMTSLAESASPDTATTKSTSCFAENSSRASINLSASSCLSLRATLYRLSMKILVMS